MDIFEHCLKQTILTCDYCTFRCHEECNMYEHLHDLHSDKIESSRTPRSKGKQ